MPTRLRRYRGITPTVVAAACLVATHIALAQSTARLVDAVDVNQTDAHIDVVLQFTCGMRYVAHDPSSQGTLLRIRLIPSASCGIQPAATVAPEHVGAADPTVIESVVLEQLFAQELALTIRWRREERFVLAPGADISGLRIRLLRPGRAQARVFINEDPGSAASYAINLDSSLEPHDATALELARERFGIAPYESVAALDGTRWYRLRIGPFSSRAEAERVLATARATYSRAWLAIGDERREGAEEIDAAVAPTRVNAQAAPLTEEALQAFMNQARAAVRNKDHAGAINALTKVVEQPEHASRADALELLGLARERSRHLAHAKAEYQEYLRLYPKHPHAARVRERLRALVSATRRGADGRVVLDEAAASSPWRAYGGAGVRYRRDTTRNELADESITTTARNSVIGDVDGVVRRKGLRYDMLARASFGHQKELESDGPGDRTRVSAAYAELADRELGWAARIGRQSRGTGGLLGSFDGLALGWQWLPTLRLNAIYGHPVESSYDSLQSERTVFGVSADLGTFAQTWDFSVYAVQQDADGMLERRALGAEARYYRPGRSVIGAVDYDISYNALNSATLLGAIELPARWTVAFNLDHRTSPILTTHNALIGQNVESLADLRLLFTPDQLRTLAEDRTAETDTYSLALSHPVTERIQLSFDVMHMALASSAAAEAAGFADSSGDATAYALQFIGGSWIAGGDFHVLGARYQTQVDAQIASLAWYTRFPFGQLWRVGPRVRVDELRSERDDSRSLRYVPSLRVDFIGRHTLILFEGGAELGARDQSGVRTNSSRYFLGAEYRWMF